MFLIICHNMKTFSDLLAIEQTVSVDIELQSDYERQPPWVRVQVNDQDTTLQVNDVTKLEFQVALLSTIKISITVEDYRGEPDWVRGLNIKSICIDGIPLIPHFCFLAQLSDNLQRYAPTSHIVQHGSWSLDINRPFYQWYHHVSGQGWLLEP